MKKLTNLWDLPKNINIVSNCKSRFKEGYESRKIKYIKTTYKNAESLLDPSWEREEKFFSASAKRFFGTYKVELVKVDWIDTAIKVYNKAENFISNPGTYTDRTVYYFLDNRSTAWSESEFINNMY